MNTPIKIMAVLSARPGRAAELRALLDGMIAASRTEPGNLRYDLWQDDTAAPGRFVLDELYTDRAAVDAHRETAHFRNYLSLINDLAERTALVLSPADVA